MLVAYCLRYDLIYRPGVLGNYVPVNYHSLHDLSVLMLNMSHANIGINRVSGNVETLNMNAIWSESIKSDLKSLEFTVKIEGQEAW